MILTRRNTLPVFALLLCIGCDWTDRIIIVNNSNYWLYFTYPEDCQLPQHLPDWRQFDRAEFDFIIAPNSEKKIEIIGNWEQTINEEYKDGRFCLYFFDLELLEKNAWETVRLGNHYLEKYTIDIASLKASNWRITYVPK